MSDELVHPAASIVTDFDPVKEEKRKVVTAKVRQASRTIYLVLGGIYFVVTITERIVTGHFGHTLEFTATLLVLVTIADFISSTLEVNFRPSATVLTSKVSDLPRLLKKAQAVADLSALEEDKVAGVWNSLNYLIKHLYPHHSRDITQDSITYLTELLATETLPERLTTLLAIAKVSANEELLPHLAALQTRLGTMQSGDRLHAALAKAIEACSQPESQSAHAIGGLSQ